MEKKDTGINTAEMEKPSSQLLLTTPMAAIMVSGKAASELSGLLASIGASVQNWVTSHGAFLNVDSPENLQSQVDSNPPELASPGDHSIMGSLVAENDSPARIVEVAKVVASHLANTFECRYGNWQLNHPLLPEITEQTLERLARAY